jgi:hypothetical protein
VLYGPRLGLLGYVLRLKIADYKLDRRESVGVRLSSLRRSGGVCVLTCTRPDDRELQLKLQPTGLMIFL